MCYFCSMPREYRPRFADTLLVEMLQDHPAILVVGPRACGKTTTVERHAATVVHLDRAIESAAFRADPDTSLEGLDEPVMLDEWQAVPDVLGAVKRAVDRDPRPGRFIVTGSVRGDLDEPTWPGTGRLIKLPMFGLSERERRGRITGHSLVDALAGGEVPEPPKDPPNLRDYIEMAIQSGFPEPAFLLGSERSRRRWLASYVDQVVARDAVALEGRDPVKLRGFFDALAVSSAGIVKDETLLQAAGISRKTGLSYLSLLANLLVVDRLPAWTSNRLSRLARGSKLHLMDPALIAAALEVDASAVMRDGDLLGRIVESFVVAQFRAELTLSDFPPRLSHLRQDRGRREIDLLVEIKAGGAPKRDDARHIAWLRDSIGPAFVCGVVMHTGPRAYSLGDRITALPIATFWGSHTSV
jgi:uncharacterized protein